MLNPLPELLSYGIFTSLFLRIVLGLVFINLGRLKFGVERNSWVSFFNITPLRPAAFWVSLFGFVEIVGGLMLFVGFYTQIAALVFVVISLVEMKVENTEPVLLKRSFVFYLLLFVISLSLLFSGAGAFSIDLPL